MIMTANAEPSLRNILAMKETFINYTCKLMDEGKLTNEYDFWFYSYGQDELVGSFPEGVEKFNDHLYHLHIRGNETIYNTYEKTIYTYNFLTKYSEDSYDWYIRINISSYLNILLIDKAFDIFKLYPEKIYCNAINTYIWDCTPNSILYNNRYNDIYPRGDFMVFSKSTKNKILRYSDRYIRCDTRDVDRIMCPHVDDTLTGLCIIDALGQDYYDKLQMLTYNYIPQDSVDFEHFNDFALCSRIKTVLGNYNTWYDGPHRLHDVEKFHQLHEYFNKFPYDKYDGIYVANLIHKIFMPLSSRVEPNISITYSNLQDTVNFLKNKKRRM